MKWSVCHSRSTAQVKSSAISAIQLVRATTPSPSSRTARKNAVMKNGVGFDDRQLRDRHQQKQERHRGRERGNIAPDIF